jgi:serine/threonine-protein kinase HipA
MDNCFLCGKAINSKASPEEISNCWHNKCVKKFFGTKEMPSIDISDKALLRLATESVNKGYTITGVQKKLSLHLSYEEKSRLTFVNHPTGYILKPSVDELESLPEAEDLAMRLADISGIKTVPHAVLQIDNQVAYITKRVDRVETNGEISLLAMEDFCQLEGRLTQDKYKGSYERCAKLL